MPPFVAAFGFRCRRGKPRPRASVGNVVYFGRAQALNRRIGNPPQEIILPHIVYHGDVRKRSVAEVGGKFIKHVVPAIVKPAHALWNEVIGFLFLVLGVIFGAHAVRYAISGEIPRLIVAGTCTALMAYYGVSSFLRARKISRS